MKILYCAMKYDYGDPKNGFSFEHYNFYDSLMKMNGGEHEIIYFGMDEIMRNIGRKEMNEELVRRAVEEKPDLCFFFLFSKEIDPETIKKITDSGIKTYNWFADDHWRFDTYSKYFAPYFSFVSTTDSKAPAKYDKIGYKNVIKTQWACNHFLYKPSVSLPMTEYAYGVTFIGQSHGDRMRIYNNVKNAGINLECWGRGWPNGKVSQEGMMDVFTRSKINLNLTKGSGFLSLKAVGRIFLSKDENGKIRINPISKLPENIRTFWGHQREQIKGRTFEIPGCGGFLLTSDADNLTDYYKDGEDIVIFKDTEDMISKIKYYMSHDHEREKIALKGYQRTIREHTYEVRFNEIFQKMGLVKGLHSHSE
jgi:spore maturation protein CgeB